MKSELTGEQKKILENEKKNFYILKFLKKLKF